MRSVHRACVFVRPLLNEMTFDLDIPTVT